MDRHALTLFFSRPLQLAHETADGHSDWHNLDRSLVRQVMYPFGFAADELRIMRERPSEQSSLKGFAERGLKLILRIFPEDFERFDKGTMQSMARDIAAVMQLRGGRLVALIVDNEPDWHPVNYGMKWGETWGNSEPKNAARAYAEHLQEWGAVLKLPGVQLVAGALAMRDWGGNSPPLPGQAAWAEWIRPVVASHYHGWGAHYYNSSWPIEVETPWDNAELRGDVWRFSEFLKWWGSINHRTIWLDEVNIDRGEQHAISPEARMLSCLGMASFCAYHPNGQRVAMIAPFVSNGFGNAYPARYVMTEPKCYELVRRYMEGTLYGRQ